MSHRWPDANCVDKFDLFFSFKYPEIYEAEQLCKSCPHITECAVLAIGEHDGVWAGKLRGWSSTSLVRNYAKWKKEQGKKSEELIKLAERMGLDIDSVRVALGHKGPVLQQQD